MSAADIAQSLDEIGFVRLDGVITPEWLELAQASARSTPPEAVAVDLIAGDQKVVSLLKDLADIARPTGVPMSNALYSQLNMRTDLSESKDRMKYDFHYDASIVTMLIPIVIPDEGVGNSGDLVLFPNRRPFRRSALFNLVEKFVAYRRYPASKVARYVERGNSVVVPQLEPGNAYLFWGYRSLHGNLPCAPGASRMTLLLHYGNLHGNSRTLAAAHRVAKRLTGTTAG